MMFDKNLSETFTKKQSKHAIATLISYCSNDYRNLEKCLEEAKKFSRQILIVTFDHFFSGEKENRPLLEKSYRENPEVFFLECEHLQDQLYSPYINRSPADNDWFDYWHSTTRYIPFFYVEPSCDYILFLDADEIIEGDKFCRWLDTFAYQKLDAMRWLQYYYFREACYRAKNTQVGGLMARKSSLEPRFLMDGDDRCGIFHKIEGEKVEGLTYFDRKPMIHHYSWVKTKEECLKKANNWSHHWEKDWDALIKREFLQEFMGKDFENRPYEKINSPYFDPFLKQKNRPQSESLANVHYVTYKEIRKKELTHEFSL